jgi:hypothetical protein
VNFLGHESNITKVVTFFMACSGGSVIYHIALLHLFPYNYCNQFSVDRFLKIIDYLYKKNRNERENFWSNKENMDSPSVCLDVKYKKSTCDTEELT